MCRWFNRSAFRQREDARRVAARVFDKRVLNFLATMSSFAIESRLDEPQDCRRAIPRITGMQQAMLIARAMSLVT